MLLEKDLLTLSMGIITSKASQLTSPDSQKSKDLNKVLLLLQDLKFLVNL